MKLDNIIKNASEATVLNEGLQVSMKSYFTLDGSQENILAAIEHMKRVLYPTRIVDLTYDQDKKLLSITPAVSLGLAETDVLQICRVNGVIAQYSFTPDIKIDGASSTLSTILDKNKEEEKSIIDQAQGNK